MNEDYADLKPEPIRHINFDAGTPQDRRRHPAHPFSIEYGRVRLEDLNRLLDELEQSSGVRP